jgi:glycosyltransferase involved in cell wall biosynthesis
VESHAEQLCPLLHDLGCEVTVLTRSGYQPRGHQGTWRGVRFVRLWAPHQKQLEAVMHTALGVLYAGLVARPDVLHIQAIGPSLWTGLARLMGLRVVVTHHGPDYDRQKWGTVAKLMLRVGEWFAAHCASELIVISRVIQRAVACTHGRVGVLIPNGMAASVATPNVRLLEPFHLQARRYVLLVSRLVPEKRHLDLIQAFSRSSLPPGWQLVIVGAADHADAYARSVCDAAAKVPGVRMTGFQTGEALQALYAHAGLFVLPSSHEGLPIAILEALSHGVPVLASDIPANVEIGLPRDCHYPLGDVDALAMRMAQMAAVDETDTQRDTRKAWAMGKFSWERNARATQAIYAQVCGLQPSQGRLSLSAIPCWPMSDLG